MQSHVLRRFFLVIIFTALDARLHAAGLLSSDGAPIDYFAISASIHGNMTLLGAHYHDILTETDQGAAYIFRDIPTATGTITEQLKLVPSDGLALDRFGSSVSIKNTMAVVGSVHATIGANTGQGAAYIFRNVDTATGIITEDLKLISSDGAAYDGFGSDISLYGNMALVGAYNADIGSNTDQGAAYIFRGVDTGTGIITEDLKLIASDGAEQDYFGRAAKLWENTALIGAYRAQIGSNPIQGAAYLFRGVDTATGTITEDVKLVSSDGAAGDMFGSFVSYSGNTALIGAFRHDIGSDLDYGAAYIFRNLDTASGTINEDLKLISSDGHFHSRFGWSVSLSDNVALIGATYSVIWPNLFQGAAYIFLDVDTGTGTRTEDVKILATDGGENHVFGYSTDLHGDNFVIGAIGWGDGQGKAYTGSVASLTVMDMGSTTREIDQISFISRTDWIIGRDTSHNTVVLTEDDSADVTEFGKAVYIGQNAGSHSNTLVISGHLTANTIIIGHSDNTDNVLTYDATATINNSGTGPVGGTITLNSGGSLVAGASNIIDNDFQLTFNGGSLFTGDFYETVGVLKLSSSSSIHFDGTNSVWIFADSSAELWDGTLYIHNWSGALNIGGGDEQLMFGSSNTTLTDTQLSQIIFVNPAGLPTGNYAATWATLNLGEVVPIPEPSHILLLAVLMFIMARLPKILRTCPNC